MKGIVPGQPRRKAKIDFAPSKTTGHKPDVETPDVRKDPGDGAFGDGPRATGLPQHQTDASATLAQAGVRSVLSVMVGEKSGNIVKLIRPATPADAAAIVAIQQQHALTHKKLDVTDNPKRGWLLQMNTEAGVQQAMAVYKKFYVAVGHDDTVLAYQAISHPRFISRPAEKHRFFGSFGAQAEELLRRGEYIYMSQIAADERALGKGVVKQLQQNVQAQLKDLPLFAHVAVCLQSDFDAWDGDPATFAPEHNNLASHRYHIKQGYVPVAWTSNLANTDQFNSGIAPDADPHHNVCGVLFMRLPSMTEADVPPDLKDIARLVANHPLPADQRDAGEWRAPVDWEPEHVSAVKDFGRDLSFDEGSFMPDIFGLMRYFNSKYLTELDSLLKR